MHYSSRKRVTYDYRHFNSGIEELFLLMRKSHKFMPANAASIRANSMLKRIFSPLLNLNHSKVILNSILTHSRIWAFRSLCECFLTMFFQLVASTMFFGNLTFSSVKSKELQRHVIVNISKRHKLIYIF